MTKTKQILLHRDMGDIHNRRDFVLYPYAKRESISQKTLLSVNWQIHAFQR